MVDKSLTNANENTFYWLSKPDKWRERIRYLSYWEKIQSCVNKGQSIISLLHSTAIYEFLVGIALEKKYRFFVSYLQRLGIVPAAIIMMRNVDTTRPRIISKIRKHFDSFLTTRIWELGNGFFQLYGNRKGRSYWFCDTRNEKKKIILPAMYA